MLPEVLRDWLSGHRWNVALRSFPSGVFGGTILLFTALILALSPPHSPHFNSAALSPGVQIWTAPVVSVIPAAPTPVTVVYELAPTNLHTIKSKYDAMILEVARAYGLDPALVKTVVHAESAFNSKAISQRGAMGLMQLMPDTVIRFRVANPLAPQENVLGGVKYLRHLLEIFDWDVQLAIAAYNAGPNAVLRFDRVPPYRETEGYVRKVTGLHELYALTL